MTKRDVISQISKQTGVDFLTSQSIIESFFEVVKDALIEGNPIYVRTFGSFTLRKKAFKIARNIHQNTAVTIDAHLAPFFKPSREFIEQVRAQTIPPGGKE